MTHDDVIKAAAELADWIVNDAKSCPCVPWLEEEERYRSHAEVPPERWCGSASYLLDTLSTLAARAWEAGARAGVQASAAEAKEHELGIGELAEELDEIESDEEMGRQYALEEAVRALSNLGVSLDAMPVPPFPAGPGGGERKEES